MPPSFINIYNDPAVWVAAFNKGESDAIDHLFHLFYKDLCYYIYTIVGQNETAEEIADDAFLKLWRQAQQEPFASLEAAKAFLRVVARNAAINYIRKDQRVRKGQRLFLSSFLQEPDQNPGGGEDIHQIWADVVSEIYAALMQLPEQQREVIRLNQQGMSTAEIADRMGLSSQTVRNYRGLAIEFLRRRLSGLALALILYQSLSGDHPH